MRDYQEKKNVDDVPDLNVETKLGASEMTSLRDEAKNAVTPAGITLAPQDGAGEDKTQLAQSLFIHSVKSGHFNDGGSVNALKLVPIGEASGVVLPPVADNYTNLDGSLFSFNPAITNTGPVTASIGQTVTTQFASKPVTLEDGSALVGGEMNSSIESKIRFNAGNDRFDLILAVSSVSSGTNVEITGPSTNPIVNVVADPNFNSMSLTTDLAIADGGTGASNANSALSNLGGEPAFSKNTAFNNNYGITAGTVLEGDTVIGTVSSVNSGTNVAITGPSTDPIVNVPDSSTSTKGAAELATNAETQTGTDTGRIVTPSSLSSRTSTTTRTGLVEKSTSAENIGGAAADKYPDVVGVKEMIDTHGSTVDQFSDLSDVSADAYSTGDVPTFNTGSGEFEPGTPAAGGGDAPTMTYLTSGAAATYNTPAGAKAIMIKAVGGGAGGETPATNASPRFGHVGGSGAGFELLIQSPSVNYTYTVGAGGAGGGLTPGTGGGSGGTTMFGGIANAGGGKNNTVAHRASASGGDINYTGSPGIQHWSADNNGRDQAHTTAGSIFGPSDSVSASIGSGGPATVPGTGGAGGFTDNNSLENIGENGADGIIVITEFY